MAAGVSQPLTDDPWLNYNLSLTAGWGNNSTCPYTGYAGRAGWWHRSSEIPNEMYRIMYKNAMYLWHCWNIQININHIAIAILSFVASFQTDLASNALLDVCIPVANGLCYRKTEKASFVRYSCVGDIILENHTAFYCLELVCVWWLHRIVHGMVSEEFYRAITVFDCGVRNVNMKS